MIKNMGRGITKVAIKTISKGIGAIYRIELIPNDNGYAEITIKKYNKETLSYDSALVGFFQNNRLNGKAMNIFRQYRNVSDCNQTWNHHIKNLKNDINTIIN